VSFFSRVVLSILVCAVFFSPASGQSEVQMEIHAGALTRIPIHVEEFLYENAPLVRFTGGETIEDILVKDLEYSGIFRVSRGPNPRGNPSGRSHQPPSDVRVIATATVRSAWGRTVIAGELRDAETGKRLFSKDYPLGNPPQRRAPHAFSDDIVLYQTGERGIADTRIAFVRDYGQTREIHLIDYDGIGEQVLTQFGTILLSPAWAPSGDRLCFTSFASGQAAVIGMDLHDRKTWSISPAGGMCASPCWSPDGRHVVFSRSLDGNSEIYVADADGGNPVRLTYHRAIDTSPCYSPDGRQIAFTSDRTGAVQIYLMDSGGGNVRRLTYVGKQNDSPAWSPHGGRIAYVSMIDGAFDVCTIRPDGGDPRRLTSGEGMHENPRWAPDGRHLVYSKLHRGQRRLHIMTANGTGKRALTSGKGAQYNPAWSPTIGPESARWVRAGD
jgi:TolB protein